MGRAEAPPSGPGEARPPNAFVTLWALENASIVTTSLALLCEGRLGEEDSRGPNEQCVR